MSEWLNVGAGCDTHTRVLRSPGHAMTHCLPHPVASLSPHTLSLSSHTLTHASSRSHSLRLSSSHSPYQISISHLPHTQHSPLPPFSHIQDTSLFFSKLEAQIQRQTWTQKRAHSLYLGYTDGSILAAREGSSSCSKGTLVPIT